MKLRGITLAVLGICAITLLVGAPGARAQSASGLGAADDTGSGAAPGSGGATGPDAVEEFDPEAPPPGAEIHVIIAGESEAAAAYAAGDSVTGFDASDMEALGALSIADLSSFTPNLEIVTAGSTTPTFFIRGVGLNDFNSNASGAIAIFQDDVALNSPALQLPLIFDMENVVIARGPVGKGPARNASGGAIRMYSRKPRGTYNGYLRTQFGNYGFNDFEGGIEAPVYEDILLARVSFRSSFRDGFQRNGCGGFTSYPGQRTSQFQPAADPRWSLCGENVDFFRPPTPFSPGASGFSHIPLNLPEYVNDAGRWGARATLRYQPTLDQDWLINGHVAKVDQLSRQGISYGTRGVQRFADESTIDGILGGQDGQSTGLSTFQRPQVLAMRQQLTNVFAAPVLAQCGAACTPAQLRPAREAANIAVANQIGRDLDFDPYTGYYDRVGETSNLTYGGYIRGEITLPNDLILTTLSAFDGYDRSTASDTDQSPNVLFESDLTDTGWQFYQNTELHGALADFPVEWQLGAYYLQEHLDVQIANDFGRLAGTAVAAGRDYEQNTWSFGTYAGFSWDFWDDFAFDGGARYNWDRKDIDYLLDRGRLPLTDYQNETRSAPTGEVRLTYKFRDDTHAYWKYTRGWKGGHFNATSSLRKGVTYAEPEENNAYEAGLNGAWFDNRVNFSLSFFLYDYSNYQMFTVENDFSSNPEFVVINASDVQVYGSEAEVSARPWDGTTLGARFGWLESTFLDFVQTQVIQEATPTGVLTRELELNFTGNRLLNSPQFTISLTAQHEVRLGRYGSLIARWDGAWTDTRYFDASEGRGQPNNNGVTFYPADTIGQTPYWLHNIQIIYRPPTGNVTVEAWVRNLTDEVYKAFAFDAAQFQATSIFFTGDPRMFGGAVTVNF